MQNIITGHEVEITELEKQAASPQYRALCIKLAGEGLAECSETLRLAALGRLAPIECNIFGESESPSAQVSMAELQIERHLASLAAMTRRVPAKTGVAAMDRFLDSGGEDVNGFDCNA